MKIKKQKHHRKFVRFYRACFGFREPYKILCDGNFIHHALNNQIPSPAMTLQDTLGGRTKLFTTRCVVAEMRREKKLLGAAGSVSIREAQNLATANCDHEKCVNAATCIEEVIGEKNSEHFFVATQDMDLRKQLQELPGVPVVFALRNALFLDPPSDSSREYAKKVEKVATETEIMTLEVATGKSTTGTITDSQDTEEGLASARRTLGLADKARFKKRAKAPNPLSCKKKKKNPGNPPPPSVSKTEHKADGGNESTKRNRKRKRSRKSGAPAGETES